MTDFTYTARTHLQQRATLGLIVLKADETIELDFRTLIPNDIALHVTRVESGTEVTAQSLIKMKSRLTDSASLFPDAAHFDCVGYACTSGTSVIGQAQVATHVKAGCKTKTVTEPVSALIAACKQQDIKRLAILSPYIEDVSSALRHVLNQNKIETPVFGSFNEAEEAKVARIDEASIIEASQKLASGANIDALFISCTNLRTLNIVAQLEKTIGKPVLTSNQVLAWHMAQLGNFQIAERNFGALF